MVRAPVIPDSPVRVPELPVPQISVQPSAPGKQSFSCSGLKGDVSHGFTFWFKKECCRQAIKAPFFLLFETTQLRG